MYGGFSEGVVGCKCQSHESVYFCRKIGIAFVAALITKRDDVTELGLIRLGHSTHTPRMAPIQTPISVVMLMDLSRKTQSPGHK
jgi:hypothetical protein